MTRPARKADRCGQAKFELVPESALSTLRLRLAFPAWKVRTLRHTTRWITTPLHHHLHVSMPWHFCLLAILCPAWYWWYCLLSQAATAPRVQRNLLASPWKTEQPRLAAHMHPTRAAALPCWTEVARARARTPPRWRGLLTRLRSRSAAAAAQDTLGASRSQTTRTWTSSPTARLARGLWRTLACRTPLPPARAGVLPRCQPRMPTPTPTAQRPREPQGCRTSRSCPRVSSMHACRQLACASYQPACVSYQPFLAGKATAVGSACQSFFQTPALPVVCVRFGDAMHRARVLPSGPHAMLSLVEEAQGVCIHAVAPEAKPSSTKPPWCALCTAFHVPQAR